MLTPEGSRARRKRLWNALPSDCDFLLIGAPEHLTYFAGLVISPFVFRSVEAGAVLALKPDHATLIADDMLGPFLASSHADEVVAPSWYNGKTSALERRGLLVKSALDHLAANFSGKRIGVELGAVPSGIVEALRSSRTGLEIVDLSPLIRPLRRQKHDDEIATMMRCMKAGEAGHAAALTQLKPGMTELDAYRIIQSAAVDALGEPAILYGDFASGPRTWLERGGSPTSRKIEKADLIILDFSVIFANYRGDFTNTFAVGGGPTAEQQRLFEACEAALKAGESALIAGNPARSVDQAVRREFAARGLEHAFLSHSGHGLGLGHPEPPYFTPESTDTIEVGDVVAIEPGLYVDDVGGMRFERNYLVTKTGFETLSNHEIRISQGS
jgi:Xaa-Pro aminopeptidase